MSCCSRHMCDFFDILYVKTIVYDTEHWLQNAWLRILLNVSSFPGHSRIPEFYDMLKCSTICQISSFRIFRDNPHEHQEIQVLACQSVTFSTRFQSLCRGVTFCDIFWKGGVKITYHEPLAKLSLQKNRRHVWCTIWQFVRLRITKREGMCSVENRIVTFWKRWLGDSSSDGVKACVMTEENWYS